MSSNNHQTNPQISKWIACKEIKSGKTFWLHRKTHQVSYSTIPGIHLARVDTPADTEITSLGTGESINLEDESESSSSEDEIKKIEEKRFEKANKLLGITDSPLQNHRYPPPPHFGRRRSKKGGGLVKAVSSKRLQVLCGDVALLSSQKRERETRVSTVHFFPFPSPSLYLCSSQPWRRSLSFSLSLCVCTSFV